MADALRLEGIRVDFPGRPGVLRDAWLRVPSGEIVVLEGRSGSGKSTLLAVAAGLQATKEGAVRVQGRILDTTDRDAAARLRARAIGLVFQHLNLLPELTVAENVELPLRLRRAPKERRQTIVADLLERFDMTSFRGRTPQRLSGGEQQRVAICRALATRPALLLVDEPTSSLDADNASDVIRALETARQSGAGILVATHDELFRRSAGIHYQMVDGRPREG